MVQVDGRGLVELGEEGEQPFLGQHPQLDQGGAEGAALLLLDLLRPAKVVLGDEVRLDQLLSDVDLHGRMTPPSAGNRKSPRTLTSKAGARAPKARAARDMPPRGPAMSLPRHVTGMPKRHSKTGGRASCNARFATRPWDPGFLYRPPAEVGKEESAGKLQSSRPRNASNFFGPIPGTPRRSSGRRKGPWRERKSRMRRARAGPIPGSPSRSASPASLIDRRPVSRSPGGIRSRLRMGATGRESLAAESGAWKASRSESAFPVRRIPPGLREARQPGGELAIRVRTTVLFPDRNTLADQQDRDQREEGAALFGSEYHAGLLVRGPRDPLLSPETSRPDPAGRSEMEGSTRFRRRPPPR